MNIDFSTLKKQTENGLRKVANRVSKVAATNFNSSVQTPIQQVSETVEVQPEQYVKVSVNSKSTSDARGAALFEISFTDAEGNKIELSGWPYRSAYVGDYFYLEPAGADLTSYTEVSIPVPADAKFLNLKGNAWKSCVKTWVLGKVSITASDVETVIAKYNSGESESSFLSSSLSVTREIPENAPTAEISISHKASEVASSAPVKVWFSDRSGNMLPPVAELAQNPSLGSVLLLLGEPEEESVTNQTIEVPRNAAYLHMEGLDWGKKTPRLTSPVEIEFPDSDNLTIKKFIDGIPQDDALIIIDTTAPPLGHKTLSLRPNNLTMAYERLGAWVIFIPFGSIQDQRAHHSDRVYQIDRKDFDLMIQHAVNKRNPENSYFICSSFPSLQSLTAVNYLKTRGWNTVYECRDDMEEFNRVGYSKWFSPSLERRMVTTADQVISVSSALDEKLEALAPDVETHSVIPNAVNRHVIDNGQTLRTIESLQARQQSTVVGYVGHLTDSWFDWPALEEVASRLPHLEFEIIGHGAPDNLSLPDNVHLLGAKSHEELPEIVARWKVALIPFKDMPLTRSVDPNKIYEYFAWGLRCVTAPMGMVDVYPSTWVYRNVDEFEKYLIEAVQTEFTVEELTTLEEFVQHASWDDRALQMFEKMGISSAPYESVSEAHNSSEAEESVTDEEDIFAGESDA